MVKTYCDVCKKELGDVAYASFTLSLTKNQIAAGNAIMARGQGGQGPRQVGSRRVDACGECEIEIVRQYELIGRSPVKIEEPPNG